MVKIDSGPVEATDKFHDTPKEKWRLLLIAKRSFLGRRLEHDCRCLIEFCEEAEAVYGDLGFGSAEEMIREGYELDPSQVELAVAWLKHNEPQKQIGLQAVNKKADEVRQLRTEHPDWTQQQIAESVGCDKSYVSRVLTKMSQCNNSLNIPDHIKTRPHQADFRKLPVELQQKVAAKEVSLNAAAIQAGIRKKPTAYEIALKAAKKLSVDERRSLIKELSNEV